MWDRNLFFWNCSAQVLFPGLRIRVDLAGSGSDPAITGRIRIRIRAGNKIRIRIQALQNSGSGSTQNARIRIRPEKNFKIFEVLLLKYDFGAIIFDRNPGFSKYFSGSRSRLFKIPGPEKNTQIWSDPDPQPCKNLFNSRRVPRRNSFGRGREWFGRLGKEPIRAFCHSPSKCKRVEGAGYF